MLQEWEESLIAVVQDSYLDSLSDIMSRYSMISDNRCGYKDDSEEVFRLNMLDSYNARRLKVLYLGVFQYYVDEINSGITRLENGIYPCLCVRYGDLSYVLQKSSSTVMCAKLDDGAVALIDEGRVINMSDVQDYYSKKNSTSNKQFRKRKNN